jgi:hypothetical protein
LGHGSWEVGVLITCDLFGVIFFSKKLLMIIFLFFIRQLLPSCHDYMREKIEHMTSERERDVKEDIERHQKHIRFIGIIGSDQELLDARLSSAVIQKLVHCIILIFLNLWSAQSA